MVSSIELPWKSKISRLRRRKYIEVVIPLQMERKMRLKLLLMIVQKLLMILQRIMRMSTIIGKLEHDKSNKKVAIENGNDVLEKEVNEELEAAINN
ncbi:hypothetical protein M5689_023826 [Euphorbia peplus]|nr:hypothetical protein M5689_023826 [Euphorbia peplus]